MKYSQTELSKMQVELEIKMKTDGIDRFDRSNERAIQSGVASETSWNRRIMQELVSPMSASIDVYLDHYKGKRGKPSKTLTYLRLLPSQQSAYITIKNIIDSLTRETEMSVTAKKIGQRIEDQVRFQNVADAAPQYIEKVQKALRQRRSKQYRHQQAVLCNAERALVAGNSERDIKPLPELAWKNWPEQDLLQIGSHLIDLFTKNVLFEGKPVIQKRVIINGKHNKAFLDPTPSIERWIEKYKEVMEVLSPKFAPCVVQPVDWTSPTEGGYHIPCIADTAPLVKCPASQRKRLTAQQMPEVYMAVNELQGVKWRVSKRIHEVANQCISLNLSYGLPSREPYEFPKNPVSPDYEGVKGLKLKELMEPTEWEEFLAWKKEVKNLYSLENKRKADFLKTLWILGAAKQYMDFENIYFVYTLDFRGRVYCRSDSISPQGNDLQKGLLMFAEGQPLGATGYNWLAIQGANVYGKDDVTFQERIQYIEGMNETIRDIATDPLTYTEWVTAKKPWQFLNWCFEWSDLLDWIENGNTADSFVSYIPVSMDGSCSGIQHYSAMLRDSIGGTAVNLVPDTKPHDIYNDVAKVVKVKLESLTCETENEDSKVAAGWLTIQDGITRDLCKKPVMTLPYGSTLIRCLDTTGQYLIKLQSEENKKAKAQGRKARRVHTFVKNPKDGITCHKAETVGSKVIWDSIGDVVVAARSGMKFIQEIARDVAKTNNYLEWITPTGFIVEQRLMDYTSRRVKTQLMGNTFMTLKEDTNTYNIRKMKSASAPNFVHSMDASHLVKAVNAFKAEGINSIAVIHDSFGTHASQVDTLRTCLRNTFVDMYLEHDVLQDYKDHNEARLLTTFDVEVPDKMGLDLNLVRKSEYCFA